MGLHEKELGLKIRARRKSLGYKTQQDLGDAAGVIRKRVSEIETGRYVGRLTDLLRILAVLDMELDYRVKQRPLLDDLPNLFPEED